MLLTMADVGKVYRIADLIGNDKTKRHLQDLGVTPGASVTVVSRMQGNFIINVRECRIAISSQMANKILLAQ